MQGVSQAADPLPREPTLRPAGRNQISSVYNSCLALMGERGRGTHLSESHLSPMPNPENSAPFVFSQPPPPPETPQCFYSPAPTSKPISPSWIRAQGCRQQKWPVYPLPKSMARNLPLKPTDGFFVLCKYLMLLAGKLATMVGPITIGQGKGSELRGQARMTARKTRGSQEEEEESQLPVA